MHTNEGALQALLDNELEGTERSRVEAHLVGCNSCADELGELRALSEQFSAAVAELEIDVPFGQLAERFEAVREAAGVDAEPAVVIPIQRLRRLTRAAFLKAAGIGVLFAGAVSAAIPGTPVHEFVESLFGQDEAITIVPTPEVVPIDPETPIVEVDAIQQESFPPPARFFTPSGDRVEIGLSDVDPGARLIVRYVDGREASFAVRDGSSILTEVTGDRVDLSNLSGDVYVDLPRGVSNAAIEVNGSLILEKMDGVIRPMRAAQQSSESGLIFQLPG